jgi:hypothetical protein
VNQSLAEALNRKDRTRRRLQKLSFEEKIALLIKMQRRAADILALRGVRRRVWPDFFL